MTLKVIEDILRQGEGIEVEFKESLYELNKSTFESICAFLNRKGGRLLLGVADDGTVKGVLNEKVQTLVDAIVNNANNPQKLQPVSYLSPEIIDYDGRKIIHVYVPESSQVHQTAGRIFDRNSDGDFDITNQQHLVRQLHLRKQQSYTENRIYPAL
jgi:ATP-dependent DNA helicase RecG